jgi:hypothetical protein
MITEEIYLEAKKVVDTYESEQLNKHIVITRLCPNCNHPNTKEESLNKYVCRYCEGDSDTNW